MRITQGMGQMTNVLSLSFRDVWQLFKPRVMSLVIFTAGAGMYISPGHLSPLKSFLALLLIAAGAGAAGCLNMWWEKENDTLMERTQMRPLPRGVILPDQALVLGTGIAITSVVLMLLLINAVAAFWLAFTILFYVFVYTIYLKPRTDQSIVIGGLAGALPPLIGWACVSGKTSLCAWALVAIIFFWTPAHFWALCLKYKEEYAKAHFPMLPNTQGDEYTKRKITIYSMLTVFMSFLPHWLGVSGQIYFYSTLILGGYFFIESVRLFHAHISEMRFFFISIFYLFLIFGSLILDHRFLF